MSWRDSICVRILLLVARFFADDSELATEIKHIANAISVGSRREER